MNNYIIWTYYTRVGYKSRISKYYCNTWRDNWLTKAQKRVNRGISVLPEAIIGQQRLWIGVGFSKSLQQARTLLGSPESSKVFAGTNLSSEILAECSDKNFWISEEERDEFSGGW